MVEPVTAISAAAVSGAVGGTTKETARGSGKFIRRHAGYLFRYKKHLKKLKSEADSLKGVRERIQGRVDRARNNTEVIEPDVREWLGKAKGKEQEVEELLKDKEKVSCLSLRLMYGLGKGAVKKKNDVIPMRERGDHFASVPVSHPAPLTDIWYNYTSHVDYEQFESRALVFNQVMKALQDDDSTSYIVGIYGLPGVGKTTMAHEVAKQAKERKFFDEITKATVSGNVNMEKIQRELAECLSLKLDKDTAAGRAAQLHTRLSNGKKILVIMDDVWNKLNLKEIGIPDKGCKILLTSRIQKVWVEMGIQKVFNIGLLSDNEAWSLFKTKVGDSVDERERRAVAKKVCGECGRLPLAILVVGGALMKFREASTENDRVWRDTHEQLRKSKGDKIDGMMAEVYRPIELSYRYLNPDSMTNDQQEVTDTQWCFLHCCLFPEDAEISIDDLVGFGVGTRFLGDMGTMEKARDRVQKLVEDLKSSSLLLEGMDENYVKMHDVIRDVAISIASKQKHYAFLVHHNIQKWPEKDAYENCGAISITSSGICELPHELECPRLRTLILQFKYLVFPTSSDSLFKGTDSLEALYLSNIRIKITQTTFSPNMVKLRMLCLIGCKIENPTFLNEFPELEILCLRGCDIKGQEAIQAGKFTRLLVLDLRNTSNLRAFQPNVISNLSRLEELYIYEFDGWEVEGNASLRQLNSLDRLTTLEIHFPNMAKLPKRFRFDNLIRFKISVGRRFDYAESENNKSKSRVLKLWGISSIGELHVLMEKAQVLYLIELKGFEKGVHGRGFPELEYLEVKDCKDMEHLFCQPTEKGNLQQLSQSYVEKCEKMKDPEEGVHSISFKRLKRLKLSYLPKLRSVFANTENTSSTEDKPSTPTVPLFDAKVSFPALEKLDISRLETMGVIWDKQLQPIQLTGTSQALPCSFSKLSELRVWLCEFKYVFSSSAAARALPQLRRLSIGHCGRVEGVIGEDEEEVPEVDTVFNQLRHLELTTLRSFRSIYATAPTVKVSFPALEILSIFELHSVRRIEIVHSPQKLQELKICLCDNMEEIVIAEMNKGEKSESDITVFTQLKKVNLTHLPNLRTLCFNCGFEKEEKENPKDDTEKESPHAHGQPLFKHKKINLLGLSSLKTLCCCCGFEKAEKDSPHGHGQPLIKGKVLFPVLEKLEINSLRTLTAVKQLILIGPQARDSLPQGSFPMLSELLLGDEIISQDGRQGHAPEGSPVSKVRVLTLRNCSKLKNVAKLLQRFEAVEQLNLRSCPSLEVALNLEGPLALDAAERQAAASSAVEQLNLIGRSSLEAPPSLEIVPEAAEKQAIDSSGVEQIMAKDHHGLVIFHSLAILSVASCDNLKYLCLLSIARGLKQLRELEIRSCSAMKDVFLVEKEDQGEEDSKAVVLPQLHQLNLRDLPNLTSFCQANAAFEFPSLTSFSLFGCPELKTFTRGATTTPELTVKCGVHYKEYPVRDLNIYASYLGQGQGRMELSSVGVIDAFSFGLQCQCFTPGAGNEGKHPARDFNELLFDFPHNVDYQVKNISKHASGLGKEKGAMVEHSDDDEDSASDEDAEGKKAQ